MLVFDGGSDGLRTDDVLQITALDFPPDPSGRAPNPSTSQPVRFGSSGDRHIGRDGYPELLIGGSYARRSRSGGRPCAGARSPG